MYKSLKFSEPNSFLNFAATAGTYSDLSFLAAGRSDSSAINRFVENSIFSAANRPVERENPLVNQLLATLTWVQRSGER